MEGGGDETGMDMEQRRRTVGAGEVTSFGGGGLICRMYMAINQIML